MTERASRFVRLPERGKLALTERDVRLIVECYRYRWLTRNQIQALVGLGGVTRANQRLRQLFDAGLLGRLRAGTVGAGLQPVYLPGDAAAPLIAAETQQTVGDVRAHLREDGRAGAVLLPHDLQVNDVRIAFIAAAAAAKVASLDTWLNARECYDAYAPSRALRPDGYFRLRAAGLLSSCFLELDRGTSNGTRFAAKVERYVEYRDGGHYAARYGLQRFRVLTLAPSPARVATLMAVTGALADRGFWFALISDALRLASVTDPIFHPLGAATVRALIETEGGL